MELAIDVIERNNCPNCGTSLQVEDLTNSEHYDWEVTNFVTDTYLCSGCDVLFMIEVGDRGGGPIFKMHEKEL